MIHSPLGSKSLSCGVQQLSELSVGAFGLSPVPEQAEGIVSIARRGT